MCKSRWCRIPSGPRKWSKWADTKHEAKLKTITTPDIPAAIVAVFAPIPSRNLMGAAKALEKGYEDARLLKPQG